MSAGPSTISQTTLLGLRAIAAEHVDRFAKEGKTATRAHRPVAVTKDPFARPSPGLIKRLAAEARDDTKRRVFQDEGLTDEQRKVILRAKAKKYRALRRGDLSGLSEKELAESVLDVRANRSSPDIRWKTFPTTSGRVPLTARAR